MSLLQDLQFEDDVAKNPYSIKLWWTYIHSNPLFTCSRKFALFDRAVTYLPRSYKLWHAYLKEKTHRALAKYPYSSNKFNVLIAAYEKSLSHMNKMPRIWTEYCQLLVTIKKGTAARHTFDRALKSLPITQHQEIWELYIDWAKSFGVNETAIKVFNRYTMFEPSFREDFVSYLEEVEEYGEAAKQLTICLNYEHFVSPSGKTHHMLWMNLCDICSNHPESVQNNLNVEAIIRSGIIKFSDEVGRLWNSLADYYIRLGQFEKARDIFEEAINSVVTVRDFTIVFDAYVKIEESVLNAKIRLMQEQDSVDETETEEVNFRLARLDHLLEQRPILLNSVILRQNPHNVHEWHKRIKLYKGDKDKELMTFADAVKTVDPKLANGKLSGLWIAFARFYENHKDLENARRTYKKATEVNYKSVDELATIWCSWAEFEIKHECFEEALKLMQQAVAEPVANERRRKAFAVAQGVETEGDLATNSKSIGRTSVVVDQLYKNVKVWSLYLDLEESLGSVESCRAAYDRVMDLKVITAQMALNYASYLEDHNFFEDSFRVYERAVSLFQYPQLKIIWITYLDKFMERYEGTKLERLRDLFEQAVEKVPPEDASEFYIKYAKAEEKFGLVRHAMAIYDRATRMVLPKQKLDMYRLYVLKVEQHFGITKTRPVYERALQDLSDEDSKVLCIDFAEMEKKLGEIDRARGILQYGSQFADPRMDGQYWLKWREFEEAHGNVETFRDMIRVQRSVETSFSQVNYLAGSVMGNDASENVMDVNAINNEEFMDMDAMALKAEYETFTKSHQRNNVNPTGIAFTAASKSQPNGDSEALSGQKRKADEEASRSNTTNKDEIDI